MSVHSMSKERSTREVRIFFVDNITFGWKTDQHLGTNHDKTCILLSIVSAESEICSCTCRFIFFAAYSPQSALTDWNLVFFSLLYTSVPTIVVGILDKDVSHRTLFYLPPLYGAGQRGEAYSQPLFWITMVDTLWQSLVLFFVPYFVYSETDIDLYGLGLLWCMAVVILVNVHLAMDINRWTWIEHLSIWGSILATFLCQIIMDSVTFAPDLLPNHWYWSFQFCLFCSSMSTRSKGLFLTCFFCCDLFRSLHENC